MRYCSARDWPLAESMVCGCGETSGLRLPSPPTLPSFSWNGCAQSVKIPGWAGCQRRSWTMVHGSHEYRVRGFRLATERDPSRYCIPRSARRRCTATVTTVLTPALRSRSRSRSPQPRTRRRAGRCCAVLCCYQIRYRNVPGAVRSTAQHNNTILPMTG